jgi:hypothetical protein
MEDPMAKWPEAQEARTDALAECSSTGAAAMDTDAVAADVVEVGISSASAAGITEP